MTQYVVDFDSGLDVFLRPVDPDSENGPANAEEDDHPMFMKEVTPTAVTWALRGRDRNHARELEDLATAFVGPSYGTVRRPVDVSQGPGAHSVTVRASHGSESIVEARLLRLAGLLRDRPRQRGVTARTLSQALSDLRVAMADQDRWGAEELLAELASRNDISRSNLAFLRLQMLNRIGAHEEVLGHPDLSRIVGSPRPRDVTQALLESAAAVFLGTLEAGSSWEEWARGGTLVRRILGPVASTVIPARSAAEARALVSAEVAVLEPDLARIAGPLKYLQEAAEPGPPLPEVPTERPSKRVLTESPDEGLAEAVETTPADVISEVLGLVNRRRFGDALEVLSGAEPQPELAWSAYNIHRQLGTDASHRAFVQMARPLRSALAAEPENAEILQALVEIGDGRDVVEDPSSWSEWLERAQVGATSQDLISMLERGAAGWEATTDTAAALAAFIANDYELRLRPSYGVVLEHHEDVLGTPSGLALLLETVEMVATAGPTSQELATLPGWVESLVIAGPDSNAVARLIDVVEALMVERPAPVFVNCVADVIGTMSHHALPGIDPLEVAEKAAQWTRQYGEVADISARLALAQALAELGTPRDAGDPFWYPLSEEDALARLRGKRIGIYTLMASVASRIKKALESWVADGDVEVNGDAVATAQLISLAKNADMMFVVTGAAKHAATDAIKDARGARPIIQVHRKGFTSLYEAIRRWAKDIV